VGLLAQIPQIRLPVPDMKMLTDVKQTMKQQLMRQLHRTKEEFKMLVGKTGMSNLFNAIMT